MPYSPVGRTIETMNTKILIAVLIASTLGIVGVAVWQQQKRLPQLQAQYPSRQPNVAPPPGLGKGEQNPLEFASLFQNLKPEKQQCFREQFGEERMMQILANPLFTPSQEDNAIIGECLFRGTTFQEAPGTSP